MIEVEIKVTGQEANMRKLTKNAAFVNREAINDTYYDYDDYRLAAEEKWLRNRNGRFELKISLLAESFGNRTADRYRELETDAEIIDALNLPDGDPLAETLENQGIKPYAVIKTDRETYKLDNFTITVDHLDFDYPLAEIEILVEKENEVPLAEKQIIELAETYGLSYAGQSAGKNIAHARKNNPELINALVKAGKLDE